jgi:hypothetical protein
MTTNRVCPFCASSLAAKRSREHVFPKWLLKVLGMASWSVRTSHYDSAGVEKNVRRHTLDQLVLGGVCRECNHGWLSTLEQTAGPLVRSLAFGHRGVQSLDPAERFTVSRWAIKTAVTLNLASGFEREFPQRVVREFAAQPLAIPSGLFVLAAQRSGPSTIDWLQAAGMNFYSQRPEELRDSLSDDALRIAILLGELCLVICHWSHLDWRLAIWPEVHEPYWPPEDDWAYVEHRYPGEPEPLSVSPRLFVFRAIMNVGVIDRSDVGPYRLAQRKNRHNFISGPEPDGTNPFLPIPSVITPEVDARIREWQTRRSDRPAS